MDRMREELRKRAVPKFFEPAEVEQTPNPQAAPETPVGSTPEGADSPAQQPAPSTPATPEDKSKKNPWKLVDDYKSKASKAEQRIAELEKALPEITRLQEIQKQMEEARHRNEELEKEIRFVNYAKSQEFQDKYEKPYNAAWARVAKEIGQITATDRSGETRAGSIEDIAEISNLPLGEAQLLAEERFGSLANYVMNYRAKILELHEQRTQALEDAKTQSIKRDEEFQQKQQQVNGELGKAIKEVWDKANNEIAQDQTHGPLFREVEGDHDGNERLKKGFELVDRAFGESPNDPRLTPEQRAEVIKRHAAVRMRAAAFGRLNAQYLKLKTEADALRKQLEGYRQSTPGTGGPPAGPSAPSAPKGMDRIRAELAKIAK